ncbi:tubulin--tyrosine ligase-like protein 12 [Aotus nancymaae]|uniref:tubulin--tyrosine ligase-like protein 12 n=1 Tax=Aotus nancymaae TaxID=37293 RepID=UPI0030FEB7FA
MLGKCLGSCKWRKWKRRKRRQPNPGSELCYKVIVTRESGLQAADPNSIFLIDHAWTCRVEHARQQLLQVPGLLHRMANLMGVEFHGELPSAAAVGLVLEEMWKFNQTYQLAHGTAEEKMLVWYIMDDEFSSRIQHADVPSFATAPFLYMPQQVAYTLLWLLRDLDTGGTGSHYVATRASPTRASPSPRARQTPTSSSTSHTSRTTGNSARRGRACC